MACQSVRNCGARRNVHGIEQSQRKFGVMPFLIRRVRQLLHIEVGEDAQQRGPHIDPAAQSEISEIVEARQAGAFHNA